MPINQSHDCHRLTGRRVLMVEDSKLNREVAVSLLEEAGLSVEVAGNGREAVDKVTESPKGYYDVVFMDIQMPVMDGYQATREIRRLENPLHHASEQHQHIKTVIIALTAHALKGEREKCLAAGMDDYLAKPIDEKALHRILHKWITPRETGYLKSGNPLLLGAKYYLLMGGLRIYCLPSIPLHCG